jgi:hypothetical protein
MTAAAFQATYSDWRLIKGRKVVQVVFEVPLEGAAIVHDVLGGMPDPSKSVWCAIARLNNEKGVMPPESKHSTTETPPRAERETPRGARRSWHEMSPAQQAGILANDPKFQRFVLERGTFGNERLLEQNAEGAAEFIRISCAVSSRADIKPGSNHAALWESLVSRFRAWELAPQVIG